ncbi:helix-turn-helix domain-containing protein [Sphingomonas canadensis]|uniref:Helix-turn-helix domain-containing protein n=1 Tax=Sphingomonas canadensis TaxID=1219257 RepID=A0ABW3H8D2_9SPHN|nr:helix-turn-helix domain-containing protein [Sphingomonas canadensis]MCW3836903.1 helix-turn-helix domain-containing protein [Sphingomonas canadensis]
MRDPHSLTSIGQYLIACENIVAARAEFADAFAISARMSVDDVAWKVGFSGSANLRRAIKRWTGQTISEIRAR